MAIQNTCQKATVCKVYPVLMPVSMYFIDTKHGGTDEKIDSDGEAHCRATCPRDTT